MGCANAKATSTGEGTVPAKSSVTSVTSIFSFASEEPQPSFQGTVEVGEVLGKGAFGTVWAVHMTDEARNEAHVALKTIPLRDTTKDDFMSEVTVWQAASAVGGFGSHVVQLFDYHIQNGHGYILMEKCTQSLYKHMQGLAQLNEYTISPLIKHMVSALKLLQSAEIVHRDIKGDNFLVSDGIVKVCDFGTAKTVHSGSQLKLVVGSPIFMSPEMVGNKGYTTKTDVWSLGVVMYALFCGHWPYGDGETEKERVKSSICGKRLPSFTPSARISLSSQSIDIMQKFLTRDPQLRPDAAELENHPFFTRFSTDGKNIPQESMKELFDAAVAKGLFKFSKATAAVAKKEGANKPKLHRLSDEKFTHTMVSVLGLSYVPPKIMQGQSMQALSTETSSGGENDASSLTSAAEAA